MLTLHKLPESFIVTSDKKIKVGDLYIVNLQHITGPYDGHFTLGIDCKKVIAQQDQIDFSALTEEEQKEIGWVDIDSFIKEQMGVPSYLPVSSMGPMMESQFTSLKNIFQKAQELLSDRRFTLEDIENAVEEGFDIHFEAHPLKTYEERREFRRNRVSKYIQSLSQLKSWEIEVEVEYQDMMGMWVSKPTILEHLDRPSRPKFTNGKIKILKIK